MEAWDQTAWGEVYRRYSPRVRRVASAFAELDADEVEDVVQESFVRAYRSLNQLQSPEAFERWIYAIARNRARTQLERKLNQRRTRNELANEPAVESQSLFPDALKLESEMQVVRDLIAELPDGPEKQTVELFYVQGELSAREIAERLGVGKSAVTMRLERFRARVKRELLRRLVRQRVE